MQPSEIRSLNVQLQETLHQIELQIDETLVIARDLGIAVTKIRDADGSFMLTPLLASKAQVLHALVMLKTASE